MLRVIEHNEHPRGDAYQLPWNVSFDADRRCVAARNDGAEALTRVMVTLLRTGELLLPHALLVAPGDAVGFTLPEHVPRVRAVALLAWTINGEEYLYRVAR